MTNETPTQPPNAMDKIDPGRASRQQQQTQQALRDLQTLKALLSDPNHWTQHVLAEKEPFALAPRSPVSCDPCDPDASRWCLTGGCYRVTGYAGIDSSEILKQPTENRDRYRELRHKLAAAMHAVYGDTFDSLVHFNDQNDHASVLDLIEWTITQLAPTHPQVRQAMDDAISALDPAGEC